MAQLSMEDDPNELEDECYAEPAALGDAGRRCTVFVVDVSSKMFEGHYAKEAFARLTRHLNHLALNADLRDLVSVVFINGPPTLAKNGNYIHYKMNNVTVELVEGINNLAESEDVKSAFEERFGKGCSHSDVTELVFACRRFFSDVGRCSQRRIIFFSWNYDPYDGDEDTKCKHLEIVRRRIAHVERDIVISAVLIDFPLAQQPNDYWDAIDPGYKYRAVEVTPTAGFLDSSLRSAAVVPFILGPGLEMAVSCVYLVKERAKPDTTMLDAETNEVVSKKSFYVCLDDSSTVSVSAALSQQNLPAAKVNPAALLEKTHIGGKDLVMTSREKQSLSSMERPSIHLLGFKPMTELKVSHRMGESLYLYPMEKVVTGSKNLYLSMYRTCLKKNVFALARCTFRSNSSVKLYALVPQQPPPTKVDKPIDLHRYEGFHAIRLPLMHNKRSLQPELEKPGRAMADPSTEPHPAIKTLVKRLSAGYTPEQFMNPQIQSRLRMVECVALKYSFERCQEMTTGFDNHRPWYEKKTLQELLKPELDVLSEYLTRAEPDPKDLARKRKQGTKYAHGYPKKGRTY